MFLLKVTCLSAILLLFVHNGHSKNVNQALKKLLTNGEAESKLKEIISRREPEQDSITQDVDDNENPATNDTIARNNAACGGTIYLGSGIIRSPNYPNHYLKNTDCVWIIYSPAGYKISLNFLDFVTEADSPCSRDIVEIRDGSTSSASLLGKFCGNVLPHNVTSSSNGLWLRFRTDGSVEDRGFEILYKTSPLSQDYCDCGENSYSCRKHGSQVICNCRPDYTQQGDTCKRMEDVCNCGPLSHGCDINDNETNCHCRNGSIQRGDHCVENCDCGINSYNCKSYGLIKKCYCRYGYIQKGDTCIGECDCGQYSYGCALYWNVVKCACMEGYEQNGFTCVAQCNCGVNSHGCERIRNVLKCYCKKGYVQKNDQCEVPASSLLGIGNDASNTLHEDM